jgi:hypothetical protein
MVGFRSGHQDTPFYARVEDRRAIAVAGRNVYSPDNGTARTPGLKAVVIGLRSLRQVRCFRSPASITIPAGEASTATQVTRSPSSSVGRPMPSAPCHKAAIRLKHPWALGVRRADCKQLLQNLSQLSC